MTKSKTQVIQPRPMPEALLRQYIRAWSVGADHDGFENTVEHIRIVWNVESAEEFRLKVIEARLLK